MEACFANPSNCSDCLQKIDSRCNGTSWTSRYNDASAAWVMQCAILMFFMKAGFLFVELSFSKADLNYRRRVILAKYIDIFAGTFGFWLFGYALSGNTDAHVLGEEQDYIFWFFRFTFATNTATILGGTLVGQEIQLQIVSIFAYSFAMTALIHPFLARLFWSVSFGDSPTIAWSPYAYCNGTFVTTREKNFIFRTETEKLGGFIFIDFAGSGLVHLCGGMGAFVLSIFHKFEKWRIRNNMCHSEKKTTNPDPDHQVAGLGRRDYSEKDKIQKGCCSEKKCYSPQSIIIEFFGWMYPSDGGREFVEYGALGIIILWTTWFAFNAGSTESIQGKGTHAAVGRIALVMSLACASAGLVQTVVSGMVKFLKQDEKLNVNEVANAVLGALVAVTGCCPFIDPHWAVVIGVITVVVYHFGCFITYGLNLYDGARVFPVHAMCGFWGVLCVGIFSRRCLIDELYSLCFCASTSDLPAEISERGYLFAYQLAGAIIVVVWSFMLCAILFLTLWAIPTLTIKLPENWKCFKDTDKPDTGQYTCFSLSGLSKPKLVFNSLFTYIKETGELDETRFSGTHGTSGYPSNFFEMK